MIRSFFVDCMIVLAVCMVVWGSAPAWAACICIETVSGICTEQAELKVKDGHEGFGCETYPVCGTRSGYLWGTVTCKCVDHLTFVSKNWICQCKG